MKAQFHSRAERYCEQPSFLNLADTQQTGTTIGANKTKHLSMSDNINTLGLMTVQ